MEGSLLKVSCFAAKPALMVPGKSSRFFFTSNHRGLMKVILPNHTFTGQYIDQNIIIVTNILRY